MVSDKSSVTGQPCSWAKLYSLNPQMEMGDNKITWHSMDRTEIFYEKVVLCI